MPAHQDVLTLTENGEAAGCKEEGARTASTTQQQPDHHTPNELLQYHHIALSTTIIVILVPRVPKWPARAQCTDTARGTTIYLVSAASYAIDPLPF